MDNAIYSSAGASNGDGGTAGRRDAIPVRQLHLKVSGHSTGLFGRGEPLTRQNLMPIDPQQLHFWHTSLECLVIDETHWHPAGTCLLLN
ncbi:MAG: hypothetical protein ABL894_07735 [Hyphomicrobium sp.]